jgi:drug/metabolite transporter (DMT)-like permease
MTAAPPPAQERRGAGIAFAATGVFLFVCADAAIKGFSADYHAVMIVWFSGVFGAVSATALGIRGLGLGALATRHPFAQVARGLLIAGSMVTAFLALKSMPLADVAAISYSTPLFVAALAVPMLGERLKRPQAITLAIGFVGVILMAQPGSSVFRTAALLAVASALFYAVAMLVTRRMRADETAAATMLYSHVTVIVVSSLALRWFWSTPSALDAVQLIVLGLVNGTAHYCVMQAYRLAPAASVAPFDYTSLVWATLIGFAVWGDFPAPSVWLGVTLVVATTLYLARSRA